MNQLTKVTIAWELCEEGIPKIHIADRLKIHRETVGIWIKGIESNPEGLTGFLENYQNAKRGERKRRQIDPMIKEWVWRIRKREKDCCGLKIQYFLEQEHGVKPAVSKIYEILEERYVIKRHWKKNVPRGSVPEATEPREVVQMDTIDFGGVFAFTGIDIFSREADVFLSPRLSASFGYVFLKQAMTRRFNGFVDTIQTDGGSEFEEDFKDHVLEYTNYHRVARPYKKNEQAYVESFNRTVRKECLGWIKYEPSEIPEMRRYVEEFLDRYHYHRPHIGCGMKPLLKRG